MEYSRRYIDALDLKYAPFLVFLGFGLGYQVVTALNDFSQKCQIRHIIVIEKDIQLFAAALKIFDFSPVISHPDIELFIGCPPQDLFIAFRDYLAQNPHLLEYARNLKFITMPAAHFNESDYYTSTHQTVKKALIHVFEHIGNDPYDSLIGIHQTIANLRPLVQDPGIITFKKRFQGRPALVIGAGPSLNKNIRLLKEARHKALLVAVDAALKPLLEAGITPPPRHKPGKARRAGSVLPETGKTAGYVFCLFSGSAARDL